MYSKENVLRCLAQETLQEAFTQSESGNWSVYIDQIHDEAKERFDVDITEDDFQILENMMWEDEYMMASDIVVDDDIRVGKYIDFDVGYGRVKDGVDALWKDEQKEYDEKESAYKELASKYTMNYDNDQYEVILPDGTKKENILSKNQAEYHFDNYLYQKAFELVEERKNEKEIQNTVLCHDDTFKYQMLSRLQSDCEYFLNNGNYHVPHLWAGNINKQIQTMNLIYDSFSQEKKPVWINKETIQMYKDRMWTGYLYKDGHVLADRIFNMVRDMDPYEAMDTADDLGIKKEIQKIYEQLVDNETKILIVDLKDYEQACRGGDVDLATQIAILISDIDEFEKNMEKYYIKRFDPQYAMSVDFLRNQLPKGTQVICHKMSDPCQPVPVGTRGKVESVDDEGIIHVHWENGSSLGLSADIDDFSIAQDDDNEQEQDDEMEL